MCLNFRKQKLFTEICCFTTVTRDSYVWWRELILKDDFLPHKTQQHLQTVNNKKTQPPPWRLFFFFSLSRSSWKTPNNKSHNWTKM